MTANPQRIINPTSHFTFSSTEYFRDFQLFVLVLSHAMLQFWFPHRSHWHLYQQTLILMNSLDTSLVQTDKAGK